MTEVILSASVSSTVKMILWNLSSLIFQEFALREGVPISELEMLYSTLSLIQTVIHDAEERQSHEEAVKDWLKSLGDAACDADDVLDELLVRALRWKEDKGMMKKVRQFSSLSKLVFRFKIGHKIKEVMRRLDVIAKYTENFNFKMYVVSPRRRVERTPTDSYILIDSKVYGREADRENIVKMLISSDDKDEISVIPIVGMGGLGKTTIAQLAYRDEGVARCFNLQMWVCVSDDFDVKRLARSIIESATTGNKCDISDMDQLQLRLQEVLRGKLFLLILDDVWNEDEEKWDELRKYFMCGSRGSKILVTTRSYKVAEIMGTMVPYALSGLSDDVCWSLFRERAFRGGEEETNPNLVAIGKKIVKKCGGLPLAAKALGGLLRSFDRDERTWLSVLYDSNFPEDESEILPALKSSYNHLPSSIKQCFAYCTIFPKGYEIKKDVLIQLWIAQSFIHESCGRGIELEDIGNEYFNHLLMRCFFQDIVRDEYGKILRFKMHNLVHNLAQSVGRMECMNVDNENWIESIHRRVRHVSVVGDRKKVAEVFTPLHKAESLRTFLILHPYRLDTVDVPHNLSLRFKGLRVLDLHGTSIKKLPISIRKLKHLRYLDLSDTLITKLPTSFTSLLNLQTLKLLHVRYLVELPQDLRKMINLRHLEFDGCSMVSEMPLRVGQLAGLQTLTKFIAGKEDGRTLTELQDLNSLRGQIRIESLENVSNAVDAVRANLKNKPNLCRLELCWGYFSLKQKVVEDVINRLQPHPNLKELSMEGYPGIQIPPWMMKGCSYCRLVKISLSRCLKWECLPPLGQLPDLKELSIVKMDGVRYIGNELFYPDDDDDAAAMVDAVIFPSLIKLEVSSMCNLEELSLLGFEVDDQGGNRQQQVILPCLQSLSIKYCPKLRSLQLGHLASLKQFDITRCSNLNCIPEDSITSLSSLCRLYIPRCFTLLGGALRCLTALEELHVYEEPEMECLPESMKDLTKLERLEIWDCPKLGCLPEWIDRLVSLRALELEDIPNLRNLPAAIKHLKSLDSLAIKRCPQLQKQCKMRGPEWRKISHIKHVYI